MLYPLSYGRVLGVKCLVYRDLLVVALFVVAICREARRRLDCNRIATRSIKPLHLLLQTDPDRVQVRVRLIDRRVPEHIANPVQRPAGFEPTRARLVP